MKKSKKSNYSSKPVSSFASKATYNSSIEELNHKIGQALKSNEYPRGSDDTEKLIQQTMNFGGPEPIPETDIREKARISRPRQKFIPKSKKSSKFEEDDDEIFQSKGKISNLYNKNLDSIDTVSNFGPIASSIKAIEEKSDEDSIGSIKDEMRTRDLNKDIPDFSKNLGTSNFNPVNIIDDFGDLNNTGHEIDAEPFPRVQSIKTSDLPKNLSHHSDISKNLSHHSEISKNLSHNSEISKNLSQQPDLSKTHHSDLKIDEQVKSSDQEPQKPEAKSVSRQDAGAKGKKQAKNQIFYIETLFWRKTTTWKQRKLIAESLLENLKTSENQLMHQLAFEGNHEKISQMIQENHEGLFKITENSAGSDPSAKVAPEVPSAFSQLFEKNALGLTPLIYAIWGEMNREDESKNTSNLIFGYFQSRLEAKGIRLQGLKQSRFMPFDFELKQELGHALVHGLIDSSKFSVYNLVCEDFDDSLSFVYEANGFHLSQSEFDHPACKQEKISVVSFAIRVKAMQCIHLLFTKIIENITKPEFFNMVEIIEGELGEYLGFNSSLVEELLSGFMNTQSKSLPVNLDKLPMCSMIEAEISQIEELAYSKFDEMPGATNFIKSIILNSKIRLPSVIGSEKSLRFIQQLSASENTLLYKNNLVKTYILFKWESLWLFIFIQSVLMWVNIPLIVLLVFVYKHNLPVLVIFLLINFALTAFEVCQLRTLTLFQYFGNVDQRHSCAGLRLALMALLFYPRIQPYNCIVYCFLTACITAEQGADKVRIFIKCLAYFAISAMIFPPFWQDWKDVHFFVIAYGTCYLFSVVFFKKEWFFDFYRFGRFVELAMMVVVICYRNVGLGVVLFTAFLSAHLMVSGVLLFFSERKSLIFIGDFLKFLIFCLNFWLSSPDAYFYLVNSVSILSSLILLYQTFKLSIFNLSPSEKSMGTLIFSMSVLSMIGFDLEDSYPLKASAIFFEFLFMIHLLKTQQVYFSQVLKNITSFLINWNSFDMARIILCVIWLFYEFQSQTNMEVTYCLVALILIRGLTGFRCFRLTRYYVRLILNSIQDILPFILIFFYSTLSFGIICSVYRDISMSELWIYPYDLNIGSASHDDTFDINYISFFVATVINVIIMLNLLISILGDSFDRFQVNSAEIDFMEMTETLVEFETMMVWRRDSLDKGMFLVCIMNESQQKKKHGKITRSEFFELRDVVFGIKDNLEKQFNDTENRLFEYIEARVEESENYILENLHERIEESEKKIIAILEKMIKK